MVLWQYFLLILVDKSYGKMSLQKDNLTQKHGNNQRKEKISHN